MALTTSRRVIPGCNSPVNLTKTDSGISKGITPKASANATNPEPAGKNIPNGKRVWESPPVPTGSQEPTVAMIGSQDVPERTGAFFVQVFNFFGIFTVLVSGNDFSLRSIYFDL
jgi:hypothetical protein